MRVLSRGRIRGANPSGVTAAGGREKDGGDRDRDRD